MFRTSKIVTHLNYWLLVMCRTHWDWESHVYNCPLKAVLAIINWNGFNIIIISCHALSTKFPVCCLLFLARIWKSKRPQKKVTIAEKLLFYCIWIVMGWFQLLWNAKLKVRGDQVFSRFSIPELIPSLNRNLM